MVNALNSRRIQVERFARVNWEAIVPPGTTLEDVCDPAFWVHCANLIISASVGQRKGRFDRISVVSEDGEFYAELLVIKAEHDLVHVKPLLSVGGVDVLAAGVETDRKFAEGEFPCYEWAGPKHLWRVRGVDGGEIEHGLTKDQAKKRYASYASRLSAAA